MREIPQDILFGGWRPDQQDLDNPGCVDAKNVIPAGGDGGHQFLPFPDFAAISGAMADEALGGITARDKDNNVYTYVGTRTKLYQAGNSNVDRSRVSPVDYDTAEQDRWEFVKFGESILATNGVRTGAPADAIQIITMGAANFADLTGTGVIPKARHIGVIGNFVVTGNIYNGSTLLPSDLKWSAFNDATGWDNGTDQADQRTIPNGGWIQGITNGERSGLVFLERSIQRLEYVGVPTVFDRVEIEQEDGTPAPGSIIQYGRRTFYLGNNGFRVVIDNAQTQPIGNELVDRWFFDNADRDKLFKMSATVEPMKSIVLWLFQSSEAQNDQPDTIIMHNWNTNEWSYAKVSMELLMQSSAIGYNLEELDAAFGSDLDALPASLDSDIYKGGRNLLLSGVDTSMQFGHFTGDFLSAELETRTIGTGHQYALDSFIDINEGGSPFVRLRTRNTLKEEGVLGNIIAPNVNDRYRSRKQARYQSIRLTLDDGFTKARGFKLERITHGGQR